MVHFVAWNFLFLIVRTFHMTGRPVRRRTKLPWHSAQTWSCTVPITTPLRSVDHRPYCSSSTAAPVSIGSGDQYRVNGRDHRGPDVSAFLPGTFCNWWHDRCFKKLPAVIPNTGSRTWSVIETFTCEALALPPGHGDRRDRSTAVNSHGRSSLTDA